MQPADCRLLINDLSYALQCVNEQANFADPGVKGIRNVEYFFLLPE
jgi:hypothetical protein